MEPPRGPYAIHRFVCSTTPYVDEEKELALALNSRFCEEVTMPDQILLAAASFRTPFDPLVHKAGVEDNIRSSTFFLQILDQEEPPPRPYKAFVDYALKCQDDPQMPMRAVAVFFKDTGTTAQEAIAYRQSLASRCDVRVFADRPSFETQLWEILSAWHRLLAAEAPATGHQTLRRSETPEDEAFLRRMIIATVTEELMAWNWPEPMRSQLLELQYRGRRQSDRHPGASSEILLLDGAPAGWLVVAESGDEIRIVEIMVAAEVRGRGVASRAIRELFAQADASGKYVRLAVATGNSRALALYERLGFRKTGADEVQVFLERAPGSGAGSTLNALVE